MYSEMSTNRNRWSSNRCSILAGIGRRCWWTASGLDTGRWARQRVERVGRSLGPALWEAHGRHRDKAAAGVIRARRGEGGEEARSGAVGGQGGVVGGATG
jgi:hypothetical protein